MSACDELHQVLAKGIDMFPVTVLQAAVHVFCDRLRTEMLQA